MNNDFFKNMNGVMFCGGCEDEKEEDDDCCGGGSCCGGDCE